jgi:hypothetical protein
MLASEGPLGGPQVRYPSRWLARTIIELHGGEIQVTSRLGAESRFVVQLPLATAPKSQSPPDVESAAALGARLRILVADDNHDVAESLAER